MTKLKDAHGAGKALVMAKVKEMLAERFGDDAKGLEFALAMFESSYDMVAEAVEKGGTLSKKDVALLLAKRMNAGASALAPNARYLCATALADFAIGAYETNLAVTTGAWPAILWTAGYLATVQSVNVWGECWLPFEEQRLIDERVNQIEEYWEHKRAQTAARASIAPKNDASLNFTLQMLGNYDTQQRTCTTLP
ncbi:MAG: hypothetical protein AAGG11_15680 [Pseudomonadota bacterium]